MTATEAPIGAEQMPELPLTGYVQARESDGWSPEYLTNEPAFDGDQMHAYARAYAAQEVAKERDRLLSVALQHVPHAYEGDCPDELDRTRRDPNCPACKLLGARNA